MSHAIYEFVVNAKLVTVEITDLGGAKSVTDDAEAVIADIAKSAGVNLDGYVVVYRDADGRWDGLYTLANKFAGFRPLGCHSAEHAVARWRSGCSAG